MDWAAHKKGQQSVPSVSDPTYEGSPAVLTLRVEVEEILRLKLGESATSVGVRGSVGAGKERRNGALV